VKTGYAQNVTISPTSGKLIGTKGMNGASVEVGLGRGQSAMWRHDQLPLTFTTSDDTGLTSEGQLSVHANNLKVDNGYLAIVGTTSSYFELSLPKGYRFTGYKIVLNDVYGTTFSGVAVSRKESTFAEKSSDFKTTLSNVATIPATLDTNNPDYVVQRTAGAKTDMSNVLYFQFYTGGSYTSGGNTYGYRSALRIKSFEITFECDNEFNATVTPTTTSGTGVSVANVNPFATGKLDIGEVKYQQVWSSDKGAYVNATVYTYSNVKDLFANNLLYESNAVNANKLADANEGNKTIYSVKSGDNNYYGLKPNTYYVETPTSVTDQSGKEVPLGYRITGATIHYAYGDALVNTYGPITKEGFYIKYTYNDINYYLNTSGKFVQVDPSEAIMWTNNNGKISTTNNGVTYYLYFSSSKLGANCITTNSSNATSFDISTSGIITYDDYSTTYYLGRYEKNSTYYLSFDSYDNYAATTGTYTYTGVTGSTKLADAAPYIITFYDKEGNQIGDSKTVSQTSDGNSYSLTGFNNDAVKFTISSVNGNDPMALVTVDLTMEALNPYVNNLDIVAAKGDDATQTITKSYITDDFTVGNGITFGVPKLFHDAGINFSFTNLQNKHADDTYKNYPGTGNSRYFFVKSSYYDNPSYGNPYGSDPNADYTTKITTAQAGNEAFKFNNVDELDQTSTSTDTKYLMEYLFSESAYAAQSPSGSFSSVSLSSTESSVTRYLFTEDETRYNIAPTTGSKHVYYAFYKTIINVEDKTYTPSITYNVVYNTTFHNNAEDKTPYVGAVVLAKDDANTVLASGGYVTAKQISDQITSDLGSTTVTNAPKDKVHIIYINASSLNSISEGSSLGTLDDLKTGTAANTLVYLPLQSIHSADNFAYKTISGSYKACKNIILTDKEPFFAPYDIQVDATHYADYKRLASSTQNGIVEWGTFVLPFTLKNLSSGVHTDDYGTVTLLQMNKNNATKDTKTDSYSGTAFFSAISDAETKANTPYALHRTENKAGDSYSFAFKQYGSNIVATPQTSTVTYFTPSDLGTSTGTLGGKTYTFTHQGTFSGALFAKDSPTTFYFAHDGFYSSAELDANHPNVKTNPFRTFYSYNANGYAKGYTLYMQIGENDEPTGINDITSGNGARNIVTGKGTITVTAINGDEAFRIISLTGQNVSNMNLKSGDSETVAVPSGLYLVNGVKVIVK
jgi:hypothetical protein